MSNQTDGAVIVVDPVSTGANLVDLLNQKNVPVICVWSNNISEPVRKMVAPDLDCKYAAEIQADIDDLSKTASTIKALPYKLLFILSGSEPGVELTDELALLLDLPGNGLELTDHRRDKYLMSEKIRADGIRAVEQRRCSTWKECVKFIHQQLKRFEQNQHNPEHYYQTTQVIITNNSTTTVVTRQMNIRNNEVLPFEWIIKPARSSGSDGVYKCNTMDAMKSKYEMLMGQVNKLGIMNDCVLVQEMLQGDEYVIDTVSINGEHRLAGVWKYLKGSANGGDFVYFGMVSCDGNDPIVTQIYEYAKQVLNSLNIVNGAGHAEIMYNPRTGPCLVEIGARPHGGEGIFIPVAQKVFGYTLIDVLATGATDYEQFLQYPDVPCIVNHSYGAVVDLVCYQKGELVGIHEETSTKMREMTSFLDFKCLPAPGTLVEPTVDMFSTVGCVLLFCDKYEDFELNKEAVLADIERIRTYERTLYLVK